jgi:hypothetical protein
VYRDEPESEIDTAAAKSYDQKFHVIDGNHYFSVGRTDWMLPVTEDEYQTARERCLLLTKIFKAIYYAAWVPATLYSFYVVMFEDRYLKLLYVWLGYFALIAVLSIFAQTLPTMGMWQKLRMGLQLDDEAKPRFLRMKPEAEALLATQTPQ